jgi:hypothetical protein
MKDINKGYMSLSDNFLIAMGGGGEYEICLMNTTKLEKSHQCRYSPLKIQNFRSKFPPPFIKCPAFFLYFDSHQ